MAAMKIFGLAGWSGSGKTSLLARLLPELKMLGLRVSTIKHAHHSFDVDQPGKDSYIHRKAGAHEVMVLSQKRWVLMHENEGSQEPDLTESVARMTNVDLVMVEGFKSYPHPKLEVHRTALGKSLLYADDHHIVAIASDGPLTVTGNPVIDLPILDLNDAKAIAAFIFAHCGFAATMVEGAP